MAPESRGKGTIAGSKAGAKYRQSMAGLHSRGETLDGDQDFADILPSKQVLRPDDQLPFKDTDPLLMEEFARVLNTFNPQVPQGIVEFSYKDRCFVPMVFPKQRQVLLDVRGVYMHKATEEAHVQMKRDGIIIPEGSVILSVASEEIMDESKEESAEKAGEEGGEEKEGEDKEEGKEEEGDGEKDGKAEHEVEGEEVVAVEEPEEGAAQDAAEDEDEERMMVPKQVKVPNKFNFCERATATYNLPLRETGTQTVPLPKATYSAQVVQWIIYDEYNEDFEAQQKEKEKEKEGKKDREGKKRRIKGLEESQPVSRMFRSIKILERMLNQNTFNDIALDYRYWDDPSDEYREVQGSLLPLWKFLYEKTKKNCVTDIQWNPKYYDLFAVTYGSFDFGKTQPEGMICMFTLKNPSFPEFVCTSEAGVMCIDFHKDYPHLIVVGKADGCVAVYDVHSPNKTPIYESDSVTEKHMGIVWQVKWRPNMPDGELNFYSVSSDGFVYSWVLMPNGLLRTKVIQLLLSDDPLPGPDGTFIPLVGCGTAIAFHPIQQEIVLVGTQGGVIFKFSTRYTSVSLAVYEAHRMPVHRIDYNLFYPDIFLSCSADWRVKIWEDDRMEPLFVFDLDYPVGDISWAPYSTTVFAAVTSDGRVHVFDIAVDKYKSICHQHIVSQKKNKLSKLAFNDKLPIMIVGDHHGGITSLKLSPNLRKKVKPPKKGPVMTANELEVHKLEKLLGQVREPTVLEPPPDLPVHE